MKTPLDMQRSKSRWRFLFPAALLCLSSCASYTSATRKGFDAFEHRDFAAADTLYSPGAEADGRDQLVYLFDRGTVRNAGGDYGSSIKDFKLADKLSEIKDYTAVGAEVSSLVVNDRVLPYKGEEFEHVLVSVYLALNFAAQGNYEDAAVAARKVNRQLEMLRDDGGRKYKLNAFAQYLAGVLFEKLGNWNFAYVDYKKTAELAPDFSPINRDLVRGALWSDSSSDMFRWKKTLGINDDEIREVNQERKKLASVVLLYQNGIGPEKVPNSAWHELPDYRSRWNKFRAARLYLNGNEVARTEILFNVDEAAKENLKERYAGFIAKRLAGVAVRETLAYQLNKKNEGLGTLVGLAMMAASQADLRCWSTLPRDFQVARAQVKPGTYEATVRLEDSYGSLSNARSLGPITVKKAGDLALLQYRSLND